MDDYLRDCESFGLTLERLQLSELFFPYAIGEMRKVRDTHTDFVYYTNAATAQKIISNGEIWLRNASEMNDFSEIEYGMSCVTYAYEKLRVFIHGFVDKVYPG